MHYEEEYGKRSFINHDNYYDYFKHSLYAKCNENRNDAQILYNQGIKEIFHNGIQNFNISPETVESDQITVADESHLQINSYADIPTSFINSTAFLADASISERSFMNSQHEKVESNCIGTRKVSTLAWMNYLEELGFKLMPPEIDLTKINIETLIPELNFTEHIMPELDLSDETMQEIINDLDLTEYATKSFLIELNLIEEPIGALTPELDLTEESVEANKLELDLTEEPVDSLIPRLHIHENIYNKLNTKTESLYSEGTLTKKRKWSKAEEALLRRNFKEFQSQYGIYDSSLLLGIGNRPQYSKHQKSQVKKFLKAKHFYVRLGKDINERTLKSVYYKARRIFHET